MICGECKYCIMTYDKYDWEVFSCINEDGRGCEDSFQEACEEFEEGE